MTRGLVFLFEDKVFKNVDFETFGINLSVDLTTDCRYIEIMEKINLKNKIITAILYIIAAVIIASVISMAIGNYNASRSEFFLEFGELFALDKHAYTLQNIEQTVILNAALLVVMIVISSWVLFIYYAIVHRTLHREELERYRPRSVRIRVFTAAVLGTVLIFCACLFTQSLQSVFTETSNGKTALTTLFNRIDDENARADTSNASEEARPADVNELAKSVVMDSAVCFAADPKKGVIVYSTDDVLIGAEAESVGLTEEKLRESYLGSVNIDGGMHYATSARHDGLIYYYAVNTLDIIRYDIRYTLVVSLVSLLLLLGLAFLLLREYKGKYTDQILSCETTEPESPSSLYPTAADIMKDKLYSFTFLNRKASPDERTGSVLLLCIFAVLVPVVIRIYSFRYSQGVDGTVVSYIGQGGWERGPNLFAFASVLTMLCQLTLILILIKFIINLVGRYMGTKGYTVSTLIYNILVCFLMIAFVLMSMEDFGIDTRTLIASLGLAGLAVSLGAKDFVSDLIAGVNLILDGSYKVGDIIQIGEFKGTVLKINMRKTAVLDGSGCVRTFSNSAVATVTNYSVYPYTCIIEYALPFDCTIEKAEKMFADNIPKMKGQYPQITEGPEYIGVTEVGMSNGIPITKVSIKAVCSAEHADGVKNFMIREIRSLFERHGYIGSWYRGEEENSDLQE